MLTGGMGIGRQSLYDTFGDKRALYMRALALYRDETQAQLRALFSGDRSVKAGFAKLLRGLARETRAQHEQGCLLLSANMLRDLEDSEVEEFLVANQDSVQ